MFVRLKKTWPGNFRRTVKDENGEAVSILEWSPADESPMEITDSLELAAIKGDLGKSLQEVAPPVTRPDPATKENQPFAAPAATVATAAKTPAAKPAMPVAVSAPAPAKKPAEDASDPLKVTETKYPKGK